MSYWCIFLGLLKPQLNSRYKRKLKLLIKHLACQYSGQWLAFVLQNQRPEAKSILGIR